MKIKITYLMLLMLLGFNTSQSQNLNPSTAYVQTCYDNRDCFSISNSALIFFNSTENELIVKVDFTKFKTGNDTLDAWLHDLEQTHLIFKGHLNTNNLLLLSHHNSKPIIVNGLITLNGITKPSDIEVNMFEIANNGMIYMNNAQDYFDRININLQLSLTPKDFNIDKKHKHYKKSISIAIYRGYINELKPELEHLLKESKKS